MSRKVTEVKINYYIVERFDLCVARYKEILTVCSWY